jgi:hypothetical protein
VTGDLPFIDEHDAVIQAQANDVFLAVARGVGRSFANGAFGRACSGLLGCAHSGMSFTVPPLEGQEVNGFQVAKVESPHRLILEGRHRFASYRLSFFVDSLVEGQGRSRLRARTDANFPGFLGAMYRALVISSGAHAFIVRRMVRSIASRATPADAAR